MATALIGFDDIFSLTGAVITASTPDANFPASNAVDWLTYSQWRANNTGDITLTADLTAVGPRTINYFGIAGHNLSDTSTGVVTNIVMQAFIAAVWTNLHTPIAILANNNVVFKTFTTSAANTMYRLKYTTTGPNKFIGIVVAGNYLTMPRGVKVGWSPPLMHSYDTMANFSETNASLGRSLLTRFPKQSLSFSGLTETFVRTSYIPFLEHAKRRPFFFMWDNDLHDTEPALLHSTGIIQLPSYFSKFHMSHSFDIAMER